MDHDGLLSSWVVALKLALSFSRSRPAPLLLATTCLTIMLLLMLGHLSLLVSHLVLADHHLLLLPLVHAHCLYMQARLVERLLCGHGKQT